MTESDEASGTDRSHSVDNSSSVKQRHKSDIYKILSNLYTKRANWKPYGRLRVFFGGVLIISPVKMWWWMAEIFVVTTVLLFSYQFFFDNWVLLIPAIILAVLEWMAFYKTCLKDPGVLPRLPFPQAFKNALNAAQKWGKHQGTNVTITHPNGISEQHHYCWKCHHYRSVMTNHCGTCDCCMIQHDHHCPVFGGCVAKNNMASFQTMVFSMGGFWLYALGCCVYTMGANIAVVIMQFPEIDAQNFAAQKTLYLILAEIAAVIIIPPIVGLFLSCLRKTRRINQDDLRSVEEKIAEMMDFASKNYSEAEVEDFQRFFEACGVLSLSVNNGSDADDINNHNRFQTAIAMDI